MRKKTPITYEDLLNKVGSGNRSQRLLVKGEGGVGKTTLCSKIAWDWCQDQILQDLDMVLVIPLRDVTNEKSIGGIVSGYLPDSNAAKANQIDNYILNHQSKVLIVFDGFDEFTGKLSENDSSVVIRILNLQQYQSCNVIVTTRPWKADGFRMNTSLAEAYTFINIEGFTMENVSTYIRKYFRTRENDALAENLISFMQGNDVIQRNIAPFPIYCAMLCLMWNDISEDRRTNMRKLHTFSQLFREMISFLKQHYASKQCKNMQNEKVVNNLKAADKAIQDEYVAGIYIANLSASGNACNRKKYYKVTNTLLSRFEEFRHLLYFTSALREKTGLDIINRLTNDDQYLGAFQEFCVDLAFECHTEEAAKAQSLDIRDVVTRGETISRDLHDLADAICTSSALCEVTVNDSQLHEDFWKILREKASGCQLPHTAGFFQERLRKVRKGSVQAGCPEDFVRTSCALVDAWSYET
ncbi:NACHT, LRR and PYD domains-containing protein 1 homolog [Diadema setosum]|uniref:NACHT, LRR and PYD domains-containing protein 1 homolog n=1 Tax=Diadema setosum TaxID=31175 RepID=UPI003B3A5852